MNQQTSEFIIPNSFEIKLLQKLLAVPAIKDSVLERNGLKDVDYICVDCQHIVELPIYNDDKYWNLKEDAADMYDKQYYCPRCDNRLVLLKTGEM